MVAVKHAIRIEENDPPVEGYKRGERGVHILGIVSQ